MICLREVPENTLSTLSWETDDGSWTSSRKGELDDLYGTRGSLGGGIQLKESVKKHAGRAQPFLNWETQEEAETLTYSPGRHNLVDRGLLFKTIGAKWVCTPVWPQSRSRVPTYFTTWYGSDLSQDFQHKYDSKHLQNSKNLACLGGQSRVANTCPTFPRVCDGLWWFMILLRIQSPQMLLVAYCDVFCYQCPVAMFLLIIRPLPPDAFVSRVHPAVVVDGFFGFLFLRPKRDVFGSKKLLGKGIRPADVWPLHQTLEKHTQLQGQHSKNKETSPKGETMRNLRNCYLKCKTWTQTNPTQRMPNARCRFLECEPLRSPAVPCNPSSLAALGSRFEAGTPTQKDVT